MLLFQYDLITSEHLLNFLRAAVLRLSKVNIYLTSFLLLFQDDLHEHLLNFLHAAVSVNVYSEHLLNFLHAAVSR